MLLSYDYDVIIGKHNDISHHKKGSYNQSTLWRPSSWKDFPIEQNPHYPDKCALEYFQNNIHNHPPLVLASEIRSFKNILSSVTEGKAFILQGGDCAESFNNCQSTVIRDFMFTFNQMAGLISQATHLPVIKIGRIAGQYAKPRSNSFETQNGIELPSFRGEIINGADFSEKSRTPDPQRMLSAYHYSSATLNLIRAINTSDPTEYQSRLNIKVYPGSTEQTHYMSFLEDLYKTANYLSQKENAIKPMYISHEALLLPYEEAMTRKASKDNKWYNCSAHMVWVGERTRDLKKAHIEYLRGIENPIGIKCGPNITSDTLLKLIKKLNPSQEKGKIVIIIRMGTGVIKQKLPALIKSIQSSREFVIWMIDPMHGNTKNAKEGYKTRYFTDITDEMIQFIHILKEAGVHPGGVHLEMTGLDVTECTGGIPEISEEDISYRYQSLCDPRLNRMQSLEIAYLLGKNWN